MHPREKKEIITLKGRVTRRCTVLDLSNSNEPQSFFTTSEPALRMSLGNIFTGSYEEIKLLPQFLAIKVVKSAFDWMWGIWGSLGWL